ncbi:MAG: hypothetical protein AAB517_01100 [Patescibacteria group bacterium]
MKFKEQFQKAWSWLGQNDNHNNFIVILATAAIIAGFLQINTIQIKIDTLQSSIKDIYGHYTRETFCSGLVNSFKKDSNGGNVVEIKLKNQPIENSVTIWEGALNVAPIYFKVTGNTINLETNFTADTMRDCGWGGYVVTYIPLSND